jgi:hypothetical protein
VATGAVRRMERSHQRQRLLPNRYVVDFVPVKLVVEQNMDMKRLGSDDHSVRVRTSSRSSPANATREDS